MTRGDKVILTAADNQRVRGVITKASPNGRSIMVAFEGSLRTQSGGLLLTTAPLLQLENDAWVEIFDATPVTIEKE